MSGIENSGVFDDQATDYYVATIVTVGTTEVEAKVGASALACRQYLTIENRGDGNIWVGPTGVTAGNNSFGLRVKKNQAITFSFGPNVRVYMIGNGADNDVVIQEAG